MDDMNEHDESPDDQNITGPAPDEEQAAAVAVAEGPVAEGIIAEVEPPPQQGPDTPSGPSAPPPPPPGSGPTAPPPGPAADGTGLVRDPHASFGGILSGIAHRYGWSVVAVRVAFAALLLVSFGTALLLYLAAWVIVPRARFWPPAVVRRPGDRISNRDLGLAVAGVGLVAFLVVGTDGAASVLVPLVLVGAGVWLLLQHQRDPIEPTPAAPTGPDGAVPTFATPPPVGAPVAPRRRGSWIVRILVVAVVLALLAVAGIVAALVRSDFDGLEIVFDDGSAVVRDFRPESVDELPIRIDATLGAVRGDLTDIPIGQFTDLNEPARIDITMENGVVDLTLPTGLDYSLAATIDDGDIELGDAVSAVAEVTDDSVDVVNDDPDLIITLDVGDGDIEIRTES